VLLRPELSKSLSALLLLLATAGAAAPTAALPISRAEFQSLAEELAPKVNLFSDAWKIDPKAEFFGGTTRDYLYWVLGKFQGVKDHAAAVKVMQELRALPVIDVRDFIVGDSDVDIVSPRARSLSPERYGVHKIDAIQGDRFDPKTIAGVDELKQGFIPAEKIRLGSHGFVKWDGVGDGIGEIFTGKLSVRFAPQAEFETTYFAKKKLNHPVLLALRYLRVQAIDYYRRYGADYPDPKRLADAIDPKSRQAVLHALETATHGAGLEAYQKESKFVEWLNRAVQKAFRSYTNPTAAKVLFDEFKVHLLSDLYPAVETYNQYVFRQFRDPAVISRHMAEYGVDSSHFFLNTKEHFPDLHFYHGTKTEEGFRGILFEGIMPSHGGSAGKGLYGVSRDNVAFAEDWGKSADRVVYFQLQPDAKGVDITQGEGRRIFKAFQAKNPGAGEDQFAAYFGVDLIHYPYSTKAYVVKNSAVLSKPQGWKRELVSLSTLLERAKALRTLDDYVGLHQVMELNRVSESEAQLLQRYVHLRKGDPPTLKSVEAFGIKKHALTLVRLHEKEPAIADPEQWQAAFKTAWTELEKTWLGTQNRTKKAELFPAVPELYAKVANAGIKLSPAFVEDFRQWLGSGYAQADSMKALFFIEGLGHLDTSTFHPTAIAATRSAADLGHLHRVAEISSKYSAQWSDAEAKEFWETVSKASRGRPRTKGSPGLPAAPEILDRVPGRFRGVEWLSAAKSLLSDNPNRWMYLLGDHRLRNPGEDLSRWDDEVVAWAINALPASLASDRATPYGVLPILANEHYRKQVLAKMTEEKMNERLLAIADFADNWVGSFPEKFIYLDRMGLFDRYWKQNSHSLLYWGNYSNATQYSEGMLTVFRHPDVSDDVKATLRAAIRKTVKDHFKNFVEVGKYSDGSRYANWNRIGDLNNRHLPELVGEVAYAELLSELKSSVNGLTYLKLKPQEREWVANAFRSLALKCEVPETAFAAYRILNNTGWLKRHLDDQTIAAFKERALKDPGLSAVVHPPKPEPAVPANGCLGALRRFMAKTPGSLR
jgi:hypothetical protein